MIKKSILILIALSFFSVCFAGSIQDAQKKAIAMKNATVGYTEQQDLPGTKDADASTTLGNASNGTWYVAGRFTASSSYTCTKIEVYVSVVTGSPTQTLTGYIYSKTGANYWDDVPNALLETSTNTIDSTTISASTYITFLFTGEALTNAEQYWAVFKTSAYDDDNNISLRYDSSDVQRVMRSVTPISWSNTDNSSALHIKAYSGG